MYKTFKITIKRIMCFTVAKYSKYVLKCSEANISGSIIYILCVNYLHKYYRIKMFIMQLDY